MTTNIREIVARLRDVVEEETGYQLRNDAADALQQQAERITAQDAKCRLYEASLDKADAEVEGLRRDRDRLDFMLENDAFTVACNRDGSVLQYQLMTQDDDENYHVLHNERRFYNTEREAIDAAIECAALQSKGEPK